MEFKCKYFDELSLDELYELLQLRSQVFVVEQTCAYQELDGKDRTAYHVMGYVDAKLCAYGRILLPKDESASFGRFVVPHHLRGRGYAKALIKTLINVIKEKGPHHREIEIQAQHYLENFYGQYGFVTIGKPYDMDGIVHVNMVMSI